MNHFTGYRRADGRFGIRNHVVVISAMDNANPVVRRVAEQVAGAVPICPTFGRGQLGADYRQHVRTLVGLGTNPNVFGAVVISLEPDSARRVAEGIAATGRPVETLTLEDDGGPVAVTHAAVLKVLRLAQDAAEVGREPVPLSELVLGVECGGSDGTSGLISNPAVGLVADRVVAAGGTVILSEPTEWMGAEHVLARRAVSPEVAERMRAVVRQYEERALAAGVDLLGANPAPDNIAGGLSTIEEKALGAIRKGGSAPIQQVLDYGERPTRRGLVLMDGPAPAVENLTALAAGGAQVLLFSTGRGNPIGNPVAPTIKVTGNPRTARAAPGVIDVDLSGVATDGLTLAAAADRLADYVLRVCSGRITCCEGLGMTEIAISRIGFTV